MGRLCSVPGTSTHCSESFPSGLCAPTFFWVQQQLYPETPPAHSRVPPPLPALITGGLKSPREPCASQGKAVPYHQALSWGQLSLPCKLQRSEAPLVGGVVSAGLEL